MTDGGNGPQRFEALEKRTPITRLGAFQPVTNLTGEERFWSEG
jgi:hypothetical protein